MLLLSNTLNNVPIMSLQTGTELAMTTHPIIDASNLSIPACYVTGPGIDTEPCVLYMSDVREAGELGFIIDDSSKLMPLDSLVRLQTIVDQNFSLIKCRVVDAHGTHVGSVDDFSFDPATYRIQQLFVRPPLLQSIVHDTRIIHRDQIVDITPHHIVVDTGEIKSTTKDRVRERSSFVNPFRSPDAEPQ